MNNPKPSVKAKANAKANVVKDNVMNSAAAPIKAQVAPKNAEAAPKNVDQSPN